MQFYLDFQLWSRSCDSHHPIYVCDAGRHRRRRRRPGESALRVPDGGHPRLSSLRLRQPAGAGDEADREGRPWRARVPPRPRRPRHWPGPEAPRLQSPGPGPRHRRGERRARPRRGRPRVRHRRPGSQQNPQQFLPHSLF